MEKMIKQVEEWEFLKTLPKTFASFTLLIALEKRDTQFLIFSYQDTDAHRCFSVLYDQATKEYFARTTIGLLEYFDVNFIVQDIQALEMVLVQRLEVVLAGLSTFIREDVDSIVHDKKIMNWLYQDVLPRHLWGFELFIRPDEPVRGINGSYTIIDYSDFETKSSLAIYYNIFRDEFFGETRIKGTPTMIAAFDTKDLEELKKLVANQLADELQKIRMQLA